MSGLPRTRTGFAPLAVLLALPHGAAAGDRIFASGFEWICPPQITLPDGDRTRQVVGNVSYGTTPQTRPLINLAEWVNLWGYFRADQAPPPVSWPGIAGSAPVIRNFGRRSYLGLHFHTPDEVAGLSGFFERPEYLSAPDLTIAISGTCGDFSENLPTPGCLASDVPVSQPVVRWLFQGVNPDASCILQPDSDYYVNITVAHPEDGGSNEIPVGVTSQ